MYTKYDEERNEYIKVEEPDPSLEYTYADYYAWQFVERLELIRGKIFRLCAPNFNHSVVIRNLFVPLCNHLGRSYHVFTAPFDVRLPKKGKTADNEVKTVVQPDIGIICDPVKIDEKGCCGAPDFMVEVLSPSNRMHDIRTKHELYEEARVPEYWIADPIEEKLEVFVLDLTGKYEKGKIYSGADVVSSIAVNGFSISVKELFEGKLRKK